MKTGNYIKSSSGRQFVIPDIHGCYTTLKTLLKSLSLKRKDQVFLLGDYINKGPSGKKVLKLIKNWKFKSELYLLRGNHDQMLLDYYNTGDNELRIKLESMNSKNLLDKKSKYFKFLNELPYYYELDRFYLVHAGFDFRKENPFSEIDDMMNIRGFRYRKKSANYKQIIHGHYPKSIAFIRDRIDHNKNIIPLDNGCIYRKRKTQGRLTCLELREMKLSWITNQDF